MPDQLSQSEIESLLGEIVGSTDEEQQQGAAAGSSPTPTPSRPKTPRGASDEPAGRVVLPLSRRKRAELTHRDTRSSFEVYDFRRGDKLSKEHIRTLQVIHENFARLLTSSISAYMRATMQVELISIEQVQYEEYINSVSESHINVLNVSPISGQAILEINLPMLYTALDRLLGGVGDGYVKPGKDLTDIEKVLARTVVKRALAELSIAWHDIVPLEFSVASVETSAQFIQIVPPNDTVVLLLFDIRLGDRQGAMSLAIPYTMLKPITGRLDATHWFTRQTRSSRTLAPKIAARLREETSVPCVARLGTTGITVSMISNLKVGQILPINVADGNRREESGASGSLSCVDLLIGSTPKFRGHIGLRGGERLAVQIDEVLALAPLVESHREAS